MLETIWTSIKTFFETPSLWYNLIAITLAAASLVYGIVINYIQTKKKEPVYWIHTTHMFREMVKDVKGLRILYNNNEVSDLSSTKFVFWNKGKDAIKQTDIASKNPIRITIDSEYEILDVFIDKFTNEDNNFTIKKQADGKSVLIVFEFMEQNDGVALQIIHTAPDGNHFTVSGKVISGSKIVFVDYKQLFPLPFIKNRHSNFDYHLFKGFLMSFGVLMIIVSIVFIEEKDVLSYIIRSVYLLIGLLYLYGAFFLVRRRIPSKLIE